MEQCVKCNKEFKTKDLFLQWYKIDEVYICKDCIEKHKMYAVETHYARNSDMTFVFADARVYIDERPLGDDYIMLSQTLIGYHYGEPENNYDYEKQMLEDWLTGNDKIRKDLIRQSFNENMKDEEVLY